MWRTIIIPLLLLPALARGELNLDQSTYRNRALSVRVNIPEEWTPSTQTGYPSLLLQLSAAKGQAIISLATGQLARDQDLPGFIQHNKQALQKMGYRELRVIRDKLMPASTVWDLSGRSPDKLSALRQFYMAVARRVFIITLTCPPAEVKQHLYLPAQLLTELKRPPARAAEEAQTQGNLH